MSIDNTKTRTVIGFSFFLVLSACLIFIFSSCEKIKLKKVAKLDTGTVSDITSNSAEITGVVIDAGEKGFIQRHGHLWSASENPQTSPLNQTDLRQRNTTGSFTSILSGLAPSTKYYVQSYATDGKNTIYGDIINFTTLSSSLTVLTDSVYSVTINSARCSGTIIDDGGYAVTARGFCWDTNQYPTTENHKVTVGTGTGSFTGTLSDLSANTTYYVRAYATNSQGTVYGDQINFTTLQNIIKPTVTTTSVTSAATNTALGGGNVTSDGGATVTARGVCWSTGQNPTTANDATNDGSGTGMFTSYLTGLSPNTTYYVRAYATNSQGTDYGNQVSFTTPQNITTPVVTTTSVSPTSATTAQGGGDVTSDGGATVTARGVCWSTGQNPTTANDATNDGSGTGMFTSYLTGLSPNTTYYVRAYATNSQGTDYGNQVSFTTTGDESGTFTDSRDGKEYNWVKIGNQTWMAENLAYLPSVNPPSVGSTTVPYYYVYDYSGSSVSEAKASDYYKTYGALYNWAAAMNGSASSSTNPSGVQGVCPSGWHLPSDAEWAELIDYLGGWDLAGGKLKEDGFEHWISPNTGATNETGFTALPGGYRYIDGLFNGVKELGIWWSATEANAANAWNRTLRPDYDDADRYQDPKGIGESVRCVKDIIP